MANLKNLLSKNKALTCFILLLAICVNFAAASLAQSPSVVAMQPTPTQAPAGPQAPGANNNQGAAGPQAPGANNNAGAAGPQAPGAATSSAPSAAAIAAARQRIMSNPNLGGTLKEELPTNLISQITEANAVGYAQNFTWLTSLMNWSGGVHNYVSDGIQDFYANTVRTWLMNAGALFKQYAEQAVMFVIEPIVKTLTKALVEFAYNPDVSVGQDKFSQNVQILAGWVRDISNDLLLLFFILSIWRYWANAAWGGGSMMGSVARIITAAAAITAWPTIYHYVILISNSLVQFMLEKNPLQPQEISAAVANAISNIVLLPGTFSFFDGLMMSGHSLQAVAFAFPVAVCEIMFLIIIGLAIIASMIVFFAMKVIQLIMIVAAFIFAPFFLVFVVSTDTESYASSFLRAFVETSIWTFIWSIYLMLFIFLLGVDPGAIDPTGHIPITQNTQNPWFVLFLELGVLQAMVQTPGYLSRGKISEAGEFLEMYGLWKMGKAIGNAAFGPAGGVSKMMRYAKRNNPFGKDSGSMALGGADSLPIGGKALAGFNKLKQTNQQGAATAAASFGTGPTLTGMSPMAAAMARTQASATAAMNGALGGGSPNSVAGASGGGGISGGGSAGVGPMGAITRTALGQFSTSLGGGSIGNTAGPLPPIDRNAHTSMPTSLWHGVRNRRMGPGDYLAAYNVKQVRPGNTNLEENTKGNFNAIDFDDAGKIQKIKHRPGASNAEIGMLSTVAALASLPYMDDKGHIDPRASSATNNAVKNAHKWDAPLGNKMAMWLSNGRAPDYYKDMEKDRLTKEKAKARISGAMAYVNGEKGNAYTKFLDWKMGPMTDDRAAMIAYAGETPTSALSGFNIGVDKGIGKLGQYALDVNPVNMGIAAHPAVMSMKPNEYPQTVPAVMQLVNTQLAEMGIAPGTQLWNSDAHWVAADGILNSMSPQHFRVASAIASVQGTSHITPQFVNHVMQVHRNSGQGEQSHAYERSVLAALGRAQSFHGRA